ncbi:MAG: FHA domain-containing protein [Myxococcaceae bacterium]|nr:FHA domain-containing protein [Myxococcaceae bacterium]
MAETRMVRLMESMSEPRRGETVAVGREPVFGSGAFVAFERASRTLQAACREERRPGVFVFAVHDELGVVGQLWLQATQAPRAGTLGRHAHVDLSLSREGALSLRHLVVLVRLVGGRVRTTAVDLETLNGTHTWAGQQRVVTGDGCLHLRTGRVSLFCVPTGLESPLPGSARLGWTLFDESGPARATPFRRASGEAGRVGLLLLHRPGAVATRPVDEAVLERGVLVGRDPRCDLVVSDPQVSRIHGLVLAIEGAPHLVDTGSTNGLVHDSGERARCWRLEDGDRFSVGRARLEWRALQ